MTTQERYNRLLNVIKNSYKDQMHAKLEQALSKLENRVKQIVTDHSIEDLVGILIFSQDEQKLFVQISQREYDEWSLELD